MEEKNSQLEISLASAQKISLRSAEDNAILNKKLSELTQKNRLDFDALQQKFSEAAIKNTLEQKVFHCVC